MSGTVALAPGTSATPPRVTVPMPLPCRPGVAVPSPPSSPPVPLRRPSIWSATKAGSSHSTSGRNWSRPVGAGRPRPRAPPRRARPAARARSGPSAARRSRQKTCIICGDAVGALAALLVGKRARQCARDHGEPVAAQLHRLDEVVLRLGDVVGSVEAACAIDERRRLAAQRVDDVRGVDGSSRSRPAGRTAGPTLPSTGRSARSSPDVVLDCALVARAQAAAERQHEQDQHEQAGPNSYRPADHQRLAVGGPAARRPTPRARSYGLVRFVEEGQQYRSYALRGALALRWEYERGAGRALSRTEHRTWDEPFRDRPYGRARHPAAGFLRPYRKACRAAPGPASSWRATGSSSASAPAASGWSGRPGTSGSSARWPSR